MASSDVAVGAQNVDLVAFDKAVDCWATQVRHESLYVKYHRKIDRIIAKMMRITPRFRFETLDAAQYEAEMDALATRVPDRIDFVSYLLFANSASRSNWLPAEKITDDFRTFMVALGRIRRAENWSRTLPEGPAPLISRIQFPATTALMILATCPGCQCVFENAEAVGAHTPVCSVRQVKSCVVPEKHAGKLTTKMANMCLAS